MLQNNHTSLSALGRSPNNLWLQVGELVTVFVVALVVIATGAMLFGDNLLAHVASIWIANVLMLVMVYVGLRLRGQSWDHFGLRFRIGGAWTAVCTVSQSVVVFVAAVAAFLFGAVLMAIIVGLPEGADMSGYAYLRGNLGMTVLALASVYLVSSFGEEVIYRGFLINRIAELRGGDMTTVSKSTRWLAVVISSIVFGLVHSDWGIVGMVQASCMGLALGAAYVLVRRNLWVTILAHAYMDTILILQMYFAGN